MRVYECVACDAEARDNALGAFSKSTGNPAFPDLHAQQAKKERAWQNVRYASSKKTMKGILIRSGAEAELFARGAHAGFEALLRANGAISRVHVTSRSNTFYTYMLKRSLYTCMSKRA